MGEYTLGDGLGVPRDRNNDGKADSCPHTGRDYYTTLGAPISAIGSGKIIFSGELEFYGKVIIIDHKNGYLSVYGHNAENLVKPGDEVVQGQVIGKVGTSGNAGRPTLHLEVIEARDGLVPTDLVKALNGEKVNFRFLNPDRMIGNDKSQPVQPAQPQNSPAESQSPALPAQDSQTLPANAGGVGAVGSLVGAISSGKLIPGRQDMGALGATASRLPILQSIRNAISGIWTSMDLPLKKIPQERSV